MARIEIIRNGQIIASAQGDGEATLLFHGCYEIGDVLRFAGESRHVIVQVDQQIRSARVYLPDKQFEYRLPLAGDGLAVYAPNTFFGGTHLLSIRTANDNAYRNLACNPIDQRGDTDAYPHATANVETRNESVFAARNVIDGEHIATGHGAWPYGSWGIGARTDAELTLDLGREVEIDTLVLYLRADFPHDAYWVQGTVALDDGYEQNFPLEGKAGAQIVFLGKHRIRRLKMSKLIKCDHPSAFPALRQIEVYGTDI